MEPFRIHIEVDLSDRAADLLRLAVHAPEDLPGPAGPDILSSPAFEQRVADICVGTLNQLSKAAKKPADGPAPETAPTPASEAKAPQAAPEAPAAAEEKEITDADLRQATKAAKDRIDANTVRAVFKEFEIKSSNECPQERRAELLAALENLK